MRKIAKGAAGIGLVLAIYDFVSEWRSTGLTLKTFIKGTIGITLGVIALIAASKALIVIGAIVFIIGVIYGLLDVFGKVDKYLDKWLGT